MKLIVLCLCLALASVQANEFELSHDQWRAQRDEEIAGPEGWMTLVGMHWLKPGRYAMGADADNQIVLPKGPKNLGSLIIDESGVSFEAANADDPPLIDGLPTAFARLAVDVAGSAHSVISVGSLRLFVVQRGSLALRVRDLESPQRLNYAGIPSFDLEPSWRINARFEAHSKGQTIEYLDALGFTRVSANPGRVVFERNGESFSLETASEPGEKLFLIFADRSNGRQTYGAGRFLHAPWPEDGHTVLDFNRAYNPPCVFSEYANCPLPPPGNRLQLEVTAGEQDLAK